LCRIIREKGPDPIVMAWYQLGSAMFGYPLKGRIESKEDGGRSGIGKYAYSHIIRYKIFYIFKQGILLITKC
jgi:hypothetical protein